MGLFYISHYSAYLKLCDPISSSFSVKFGMPYKVQTRIGAIYFSSLQVLFSSFKKKPKTIIRSFSTLFWFEKRHITGFSMEPRLSSRNTLLLIEHTGQYVCHNHYSCVPEYFAVRRSLIHLKIRTGSVSVS